MRTISIDEMRGLEAFAAEKGITTAILMEMAGMKLASIAQHEIRRASTAVVLSGIGGNGGDGFVAARYLHNSGIRTDVYLTGNESQIKSQETKINLDILKKLGIPVKVFSSDDISGFKSSLLASDMVIDAVYGIGFKGSIPSKEKELFALINNTRLEIKDKKPYAIISADIPSGIGGDDGSAADGSIKSDITVTFEYPKIGLYKYPASSFAGKIINASIGIPRPNPVEKDVFVTGSPHQKGPKTVRGINITDGEQVSAVFPRPKNDANKGDKGRILIVAGSSGMMGAAVITSTAALRAGSGVVTLAVPDDIINNVNTMTVEAIVTGFNSAEEKASQADCVAIGPGLSKGSKIDKLVHGLLMSKKISCPVVIDADGLNAIKDPSVFKRSQKEIVITPHPGEFSRLTGISIDTIQKDRLGHAGKFAVKYGVTVVLKGAYTVIATPDGGLTINPIANPVMATAGSGDILTGMIASLIGQGMKAVDASVAGAYLHGLAGQLAASMKGGHGIIAGDIIESIPFAIDSVL